MSKDFPKKYSPEIEAAIYEYWTKKWLFNAQTIQQIKNKPYDGKFVISMPPPNVTGVLHLWHAMMLSVEDAMVRYSRMQNKETIYIPGTDHAWISTQVVVEKKVQKEQNKNRHHFGREKFLWLIWDWVKFSRSTIIEQTKKMWTSCDWSREQFTLSEKLSRAVRKAFVELHKTGKIYKDTYIVNWDPVDQTVLSDLEVLNQDITTKIYYVKYFIEGKGDSITVATVRPETIFADVAIAVNPKDRRYKKFIWKTVLIPIINKPIPVIADEYVDITFGTGALKITPAHDINDYKIWLKHNLPMDKSAIDKFGKMTDLAGEFAGIAVEDVFENIIQYLREIGNLDKIEDYQTTVPVSERRWTRIQPLISTQWFLNVKDAAQRTIEEVNDWTVQIHPDRFKKNLFSFIENIQPWCISRQLWWWHRIPVWYGPNGIMHVFDEDEVLSDKTKKIILSQILFNLIADSRLAPSFNLEDVINLLLQTSLTPQEGSIYTTYLSIYRKKYVTNKKLLAEIEELSEIFDSIKQDSKSIIEHAPLLVDILEESSNISKQWDMYKFDFISPKTWEKWLVQDEDVLDTWFSSWLWPFAILGWPESTPDLSNYYPNTVLETGYDIIFFWVAKMLFQSYELMDKKPFDNIYLHWLVRDKEWQKMSKSKWNVVDPLEVIEKYGSDSLKLGLLIGSTPWNDIKYSDDKVEYYWRFLNKLWNATRFIWMNVLNWSETILDYDLIRRDIQDNADSLHDFDKWIVDQISQSIKETQKYQEKFMLGEAASLVVKTAWHDFCDWYIEISKLDKSPYTDKVLLYCIGSILKMLHPFAPFATEKLWTLIGFEGDLIISDYAEAVPWVKSNVKLHLLMDIITEFRNLRNQADLKPHEKADIIIHWNSSFLDFAKSFEGLMKSLLNIDKIEYTTNDINPQGYITSIVFDIKIWLHAIKELNIGEKMLQLQQQVRTEEQFLQNLRNVITAPWFLDRAPENVVQEKQQKMEEVKAKILALNHEINKLKLLQK